MKWLKLIFLGLCGLQICQLSYAQEALTEKYSQSELLRNWALSHCLSLVYKNDAVQDDARATASAYLEYGQQPVEIYREIDAIARKYASLKYDGSIASDFSTMKCIDFIHGNELDELISGVLRNEIYSILCSADSICGRVL
ncbi:T6SS amidase immunity protein Tai4 family protein [Escherichia coli]